MDRLGALAIVTYQSGENVLTAGSKTGRLLILKKGAVAIVKETIEIAKVSEPGAVFGELSALLSAAYSGRACLGDLAVLRRRCGCSPSARSACASVRGHGSGTSFRRRQSSPH